MINIRETYTATDRATGAIVAVVDMQSSLDTRSGVVARRLTITPTHEAADFVCSGDFDLQLVGQFPSERTPRSRDRAAQSRRAQFRAVSANDDNGQGGSQ